MASQKIEVDLIVHARWIIPIIPKEVCYNNYAIVSKGTKIVDLLPSALCSDKYVAKKEQRLSKEHILIPGLINLHCHSPMSLLRGFAEDGVDLMDWLMHYMWPAEREFVSAEFCRVGSELTIAELLLNGVTCFNDMYFFPEETAVVAEKSGIRACIGATVISFPSAYASSADEYVSKGAELLEKYKNHEKIKIFVAPHSTYTVQDEHLLKLKELQKKYNTRMHIHLHETKKEVEDHLQQHNVRPLERLKKLGLCDDHLLAVHMTQLEDDEISYLSQTGVNIVHCPESNLKLKSGVCPVGKLSKSGVNVTVGTDGPASNDDVDLIGEMRTSALIHKLTPGDIPLDAWFMLEMATLNGAKALGMEKQIGSLEIGKEADFVAVRISSIPVYHPINSLLYVGTNRVDHVFIGGRHVVASGELLTLKVENVHEGGFQWGNLIQAWDLSRRTVPWETLEELLSDKKVAEMKNHDKNSSQYQDWNDRIQKIGANLFHWKFFWKTNASIVEKLKKYDDNFQLATK